VILTELLESKQLNSTGDSQSVGAEFGKKIEQAVKQLASDIGTEKSSKEKAKTELKEQISIAQEKSDTETYLQKMERRAKVWGSIGITLLVVGSIGVMWLGYYTLKNKENVSG
jgi:hypothetical protein